MYCILLLWKTPSAKACCFYSTCCLKLLDACKKVSRCLKRFKGRNVPSDVLLTFKWSFSPSLQSQTSFWQLQPPVVHGIVAAPGEQNLRPKVAAWNGLWLLYNTHYMVTNFLRQCPTRTSAHMKPGQQKNKLNQHTVIHRSSSGAGSNQRPLGFRKSHAECRPRSKTKQYETPNLKIMALSASSPWCLLTTGAQPHGNSRFSRICGQIYKDNVRSCWNMLEQSGTKASTYVWHWIGPQFEGRLETTEKNDAWRLIPTVLSWYSAMLYDPKHSKTISIHGLSSKMWFFLMDLMSCPTLLLSLPLLRLLQAVKCSEEVVIQGLVPRADQLCICLAKLWETLLPKSLSTSKDITSQEGREEKLWNQQHSTYTYYV